LNIKLVNKLKSNVQKLILKNLENVMEMEIIVINLIYVLLLYIQEL